MPLLEPDIVCPRYAKIPGSNTCQHYAGRGACSLPDVFMCVEWLRKNPALAMPGSCPSQEELLVRVRNTVVAGKYELLEQLGPRPGRVEAPRPSAPQPAATAPAGAAGGASTAELAEYGRSIDDLAALGHSFDLDTAHGSVRLVPQRSSTPEDGVLELTFAEARALVLCASVFPGSHVTKIRRK